MAANSGIVQIMMGVHGNGLTSLIWMKPSPRTTVMEFFYPGGFAHDYEWTSRALGMVHYGFWGDRFVTSRWSNLFCTHLLFSALVPSRALMYLPWLTLKVSKAMQSPSTAL